MTGEQPLASSSRVTLDGSPRDDMPYTAETITTTDAEGGLDDNDAIITAAPTTDHKGKAKAVSGQDEAQSLDELEDEEEYSDTEDEEGDEAYERDRQRRIRENQMLIDSLGIKPSLTPLTSSFSIPTPGQSTAKRKYPKKREGTHKEVYDRSGYIVSLPRRGERRQRMACVEMPFNRQLTKRIAEGEYGDCEHWWEGEERRWRVGHGKGNVKEGEEYEVGGVTKEFRWRKWRGLEKELRKEMKQRGESNKRDKAGAQQPIVTETTEPTPYHLLPEGACHQCRRRSEKLKMKCRNINPICRAVFCETCCKRYSYFDFDIESRSFICPLCKDCCNCANCIRKRDLHHLLGPGRVGAKSKDQLSSGMTVQAWLEKATQEKVGVPFERVRLVDQATDIISPDLPPETPPAVEKVINARKRKAKALKLPKEPKAKKAKKSAKGDMEDENKGKENGLKIRIKVPLRVPRPKEVDSDGDTVGGYSDDEDARSNASSKLTSLSAGSSTPSIVPPRLAFPPRASFPADTNQYLATIAAINSKSSPEVSPSARRPQMHSTLAAAMSHMTDFTDETSGQAPVMRGESSSESITGNTPRKRRKPPPQANILRAPKYTTIPQPLHDERPATALPEPETPLTADDSQTWQDDPDPMQFQSFSYDGYSTVPPAPALSPLPPLPTLPAQPTHQPMPQMPVNVMSYGFPPPYSHSPPSRQSVLAIQETGTYLGIPTMGHQPYQDSQHVSPRGAGGQLLPPVGPRRRAPSGPPGSQGKASFVGPAPMGRTYSGEMLQYEQHVTSGYWSHQSAPGRPNGGGEVVLENGLMLNRRYYPGHP